MELTDSGNKFMAGNKNVIVVTKDDKVNTNQQKEKQKREQENLQQIYSIIITVIYFILTLALIFIVIFAFPAQKNPTKYFVVGMLCLLFMIHFIIMMIIIFTKNDVFIILGMATFSIVIYSILFMCVMIFS